MAALGLDEPAVVSPAREVVTMDPARPTARVTALGDRYGEQGIGPQRADAIARLGEVARAGVPISLHSDMPMAPGQPLFLMWCAVNRTTVSGRTARPDLRISAEQALRAVTLDAAHSIRLEAEIGSIEAGKKANLTVLADNPLTVEPTAIKDITVWGTVLEGRVPNSSQGPDPNRHPL